MYNIDNERIRKRLRRAQKKTKAWAKGKRWREGREALYKSEKLSPVALLTRN
jgi:hypothetical protein